MKGKLGKISAILIAATFLMSVITIFPVYASPTRIYLDPADNYFETDTTSPCYKWNITIWVADVTNLFAFQVYLDLTACDDYLNITGAWNPTWDPDWVFKGQSTVGTLPVISDADNDGNNDGALLGDSIIVGTAFTGTGKLGIIELHIKKAPEEGETINCDLNIGNVDTFLLDNTLNDIITTKENGSFTYGWPEPPPAAKLYVDPPEIIDPTLTPGSEFCIDIKIENVVDLYGYEFNLTYNTEVLTCLGALIFPPDNDTNFVTEIQMVDEIGYIMVNVTYHPPAEPFTILPPTTIVMICFQVESYGYTVLDLHDTKLVDPTGQPIPHEVGDGFVMTVIRDVAITNVTTPFNAIYQGWIIDITVIAKNEGDINETFDVNIYYGMATIGTLTVTDLAPDTETTLIFSWDTQNTSACNNLTISAEALPVPDEIDLTNNVFVDGYMKIKLMADLNGDNKVDIRDIAAAALAFGSRPGDPKWNPDADLVRDDYINIRDLALAAKNFGKSC